MAEHSHLCDGCGGPIACSIKSCEKTDYESLCDNCHSSFARHDLTPEPKTTLEAFEELRAASIELRDAFSDLLAPVRAFVKKIEALRRKAKDRWDTEHTP